MHFLVISVAAEQVLIRLRVKNRLKKEMEANFDLRCMANDGYGLTLVLGCTDQNQVIIIWSDQYIANND